MSTKPMKVTVEYDGQTFNSTMSLTPYDQALLAHYAVENGEDPADIVVGMVKVWLETDELDADPNKEQT